MIVYFITENYIKTRTQLSQNIDYADIAPNIAVAALDYVRPILGKAFFDDLLTKYNAQTLNSNEEEVVEIIQKVVAFRAADITAPFISFALKNKGVQSQSGDFSGSESIQVVNYIRNELQTHAYVNEKELKAYLKENKDNFPIYTSPSNDVIVEPEEPEENSGVDFI